MMMVTEGAYAYSEAFLPLFSRVFFLYYLKNFSDDDDKSLWRCLIIEFLYLSDRDFSFSCSFYFTPLMSPEEAPFSGMLPQPSPLVISRPDKGRILCCICLIFFYPSSMALQSFLIFSFLTNSLS